MRVVNMSEKGLITKNVIHTGNQVINFVPGTKVIFHFRTTKCDPGKTVIDDSKKMGNPMELVLGKQFKLEVWEAVVQKMALNEVALFRVDKSLVTAYPFVSKTLRELGKPASEKKNVHRCGVALQNEGIGYNDLNELIRYPQDLEFTIELIKVESPDEYEKETWQMTEEEKLKSVIDFKEKGNNLFKQKDYEGACDMYSKGVGILMQLMLTEKPNDEEWLALNNKKTPLLLNIAQCKLLQKDYYPVIEHCTSVLKYEPDNVKALYRRGKAYVGVWDEEKAKADFKKVADLDPSLWTSCKKELDALAIAINQLDKTEKKKFAKMFI